MAVPWKSIIRWAPQLMLLSRELMQRAGHEGDSGTDGDRRVVAGDDRRELLIRIAALEENERGQAALVERLAQHQTEMTKALLAMHRRERVVAAAFVVLLGLVIWALLR